MPILVVGVNHKTAPLHVRDRVAVGSDQMEGALNALRHHVGSGVILSTCNRSEVYALVPNLEQGTDAVMGYISAYHGVAQREIAPYLYTYDREAAVRHLFRVASGLDSMILGEAQILGQVRRAFGASKQHGLSNPTLARLFDQAVHTGRRARGETAIGRNALSVSRAAVELARRAFEVDGPQQAKDSVGQHSGGQEAPPRRKRKLKGKRVLVLGLGDAGKLAIRALIDAGAGDILVVNRTYQRAVESAAELGGVPVPFEELGDALVTADIIVTATGSPDYVLTADMIARARSESHRPLFIIDIAVPRDVDPAAKKLPGVHLYDIDDLEAVSETNRRERDREASKVEAIIAEEEGRFMEWLASREVVPTVAALREHAEAIRTREIARLLRRLPGLSEEERKPLEAFSQALVKKLLHGPITSLKGDRRLAHAQAVRELFDLDGDRS